MTPTPQPQLRPPFPRLWALVLAGAAVVVVFVFYCWGLRLSDDLAWDEAYNYRTYARHPLIALALYWEPNNHVLESFIKSVTFGLLKLNRPEFYRLPGAGVLAVYLLITGWWFVKAWRAGSRAAAVAFVLGLVLSRGVFVQALQLRGYFLTMTLTLLFLHVIESRQHWFPRLRGHTAFFSSPMPHGSTHATYSTNVPNPFSRRTLIAYCILGALLLLTLPSNLLLLPALWALAAFPFRTPDDDIGPATPWRQPAPNKNRSWRFLLFLAAGTALLTIIFYSPIVLGFLLGVNRVDNVPASSPASPLAALASDFRTVFSLAAPMGLQWFSFLALLVAIFVVAFLLAWRSRRALQATPHTHGSPLPMLISDSHEPHIAALRALILLCLAVAVPLLFGAIVGYPERAKTVYAPPVIVAFALAIGAATRRRPALQLPTAAALTLGALCLLPAVADATHFRHDATKVAAFLETYVGPGEGRILIAHKSQNLHPYLRDAFPGQPVVLGELDLDLTFNPEESETELMQKAWLQRIRNLLLPPREFPQATPEQIDQLVYIVDEKEGRDPTQWDHPALRQLEQRLTRREEFRVGPYRIFVLHE